MTNRNEGEGFVFNAEIKTENLPQEISEPKESEIMKLENSELENQISRNEEMVGGLEKSVFLGKENDAEGRESRIDPKIVDYFRNAVGVNETLKRLRQMGEGGIQRIVKEIQAGNFRLVVHIMELGSSNNQWNSQAAFDSISNDPAKRDRSFASVSKHFSNHIDIVKGIEDKHELEDSEKWTELYKLLGL